MDLGLAGKVAIISGGSYGIGKSAATSVVREGAKVTICARRGDVLEEAAQDIRAATGNGEVLPVSADVTRLPDIEKVVNATVERFGRIDILINNAGHSAANPFENVADEDWEADFDLKLRASIRFSRLCVPHMKKVGGGRIINVTNIGSKTPGASSLPTSVTRAAGNALTKAMSKDLAKDNILVNSICIGLVKSGQMERQLQRRKANEPDLTLEQVWVQGAERNRIPLGRVGETDEAGDVICFLASARASFINGVALNIDGGSSPVL